ncbi:MAG: hypothetical protein ACD_3C00111G0030 [uncultured bacterium (gcode 4)]|uniref:Uncharacterized protein n=1 Tax=uncultured bacterium (gcode 4) TaxID=1234023 RepID=K2FYJ3_9BACT|nr:MAG: hypothetical protein ACD_3C00111G0030 [uncultured bacterium (gcode 4)]
MYSIDREQAAKELNMSTRTIDRYIRAWKIRSQKRWKKVFLHDQDIKIFKTWWIQEDYEIIEPASEVIFDTWFVTKAIDSTRNYKNLYEDTQKIIEKKDEIIKDISYRLGKAEVELKNSIPMLEYKKTTFLLESSNNKIAEEKKEMNDNLENLKEKVRNQELINIMLIAIFSIMLIVVFFVWFANV